MRTLTRQLTVIFVLFGLAAIAVDTPIKNLIATTYLAGSTAANGDLVINGTTHATKTTSQVLIQLDGGQTVIGAGVAGSAFNVNCRTIGFETGGYGSSFGVQDGDYYLGDFVGGGNNSYIRIHDSTNELILTSPTGTVKIQTTGGDVRIGNSASMAGNDWNAYMATYYFQTPTYTGWLEMTDGIFRAGDTNAAINGTFMEIDDAAGTISFTAPTSMTINGGPLNASLLKVGSGSSISKTISTTTTWDPGSLNNGASEKKSAITMTGVSVGDVITAALTTIVSSDWDVQAVVTATNTAEVKITNNTGGTVDLASGTLRLNCIKF